MTHGRNAFYPKSTNVYIFTYTLTSEISHDMFHPALSRPVVRVPITLTYAQSGSAVRLETETLGSLFDNRTLSLPTRYRAGHVSVQLGSNIILLQRLKEGPKTHMTASNLVDQTG